MEEISCEWRLASQRLKNEPHHLWYILKHILAAKFTCLFRGIPPGYAHPLADCLTELHRETCEILAQCETISNLSFDLVQIRERCCSGICRRHAGLPPSLRSIEQANTGYLDAVKTVYVAGPTASNDLTTPLPVRQLASALLAVDPTFLQDDRQGQDYSELRKLQSVF